MENFDLIPRIIDIPRVCDPRGNLSFLQRPGCLPFDVRRVYYLYDVPCDSERGGHSHRKVHEILIAVTGAFEVRVQNGQKEWTFTLNRPYQGLLLPQGVWRTLHNFTSGAVCLVLASDIFDEAEYVRDYDEFLDISARRISNNPSHRRFPFLSLDLVNQPYKQAMKDAACRVIDSGRYIGGEEVEEFEREIGEICEVPYVVGVSNGLDALRLILRAYIELGRLKPGDEVIVPADTYVATVLAVSDNNLVPVFADVDLESRNLKADAVLKVITPKTKAIIPVHLYGRVCWDEDMAALINQYDLLVIEDNAQAIMAQSNYPGLFGTKMTGGLGNAAGISFYPTKNLGAIGDAGAVATHDKGLADVVRALRNYGSDRQYHNIYTGLNCRLDPIQAAMMRVKIPYLRKDTLHRRAIAEIYQKEIINPLVQKPILGGEDCVWHQYVVLVEKRDDFRRYLLEQGVETAVHYPCPPYKQPCYSQFADDCFPNAEMIANKCVSLPISTCTSLDDAYSIAQIINSFNP